MNRRELFKKALALGAVTVAAPLLKFLPDDTSHYPSLGGTWTNSPSCPPLTLSALQDAVQKIKHLEYIPETIYLHPSQIKQFNELVAKDIEADLCKLFGTDVYATEHTCYGNMYRVKDIKENVYERQDYSGI